MDEQKATETFEKLYAQLEEIVARLEQGGLPLDDAIALYEQGIALAQRCQEMLDAAELKVTRLREAAVSPYEAAPTEDDTAELGDED